MLGPVDGSLRQVRPGDTLLLEHHLDALSVAVSLREHLSLERLAVLGPVVIDAEQARRTAVTNGRARSKATRALESSGSQSRVPW